MKYSISLPEEKDIKKGLLKVIINNKNSAASSLQVSIDDVDAGIIEVDGNSATWFAIVTHLLTDGKHTIKIAEDRRVIWKKSVETRNASLLGSKVGKLLAKHQMPVLLENEVSHSVFPQEPIELAPWFEREDGEAYIKTLEGNGQISDEEAEQMRLFYTDGYVWLKNIVDEELLNKINQDYDDIEENERLGFVKGSSKRINGTHRHYKSIHELWKYPIVMRYLKLIFQSDPLSCQTLSYINGSEQKLHQDTVHLTPFPAGNMCGVWYALEDIKEGSGELEFVPKSHRFPKVYRDTVGCEKVNTKVDNPDWGQFEKTVIRKWRELLTQSNLKPITYSAKRGDVLIWHENLLHGGKKRINRELSRRCLVGHYFADGSIAYYDSLGLPGFI